MQNEMARIEIDKIEKKDKKIGLVDCVDASYTISEDGIFQIDTYSGKSLHQTQSIQFDKDNLSKLFKLISKEYRSFDIPLLDDNGDVKYGVNWGNRAGRNVNQAYLDLPIEIYNSDFFPSNGTRFVIRTDDGKDLTCTRAQKDNVNGHAIQTPEDNTILGVYLRNRLSVEKGQVITKEDIVKYGRNYITISKIGEFFFLDFSKKNVQKTFSQPVESSYSNFRSYFTAIKSKPFLLLAGISGTGKSRIVRELARACWPEGCADPHKPQNYELVQVKPNWHDSSELIGYVSRVSGTPVFVAGPFLKFVAKAWEDKEHPYFLCLDEMNLAPVEQYFAEYLSVIETRKYEDGVVVTDAVLTKSEEDWYRVLTSELTENENLRNQFLENGISIPQNLIVVGTVNMDETTFSFSRKVLDRAMTIEMNEVDLMGGLTDKHEQIGLIKPEQLIGTAVEGVDVYADYKDVCDIVIAYLQKINDVLEGTPFKIAYRTRNEFLLYVVNNLPYNKDDDGNEIPQNEVIARALDEITSMKILSRIEGDDAKVGKLFEGENSLSNTIKNALNAVSGKEYAAKATDDGTIASISLAKLAEMKKRLESGYTSFWS